MRAGREIEPGLHHTDGRWRPVVLPVANSSKFPDQQPASIISEADQHLRFSAAARLVKENPFQNLLRVVILTTASVVFPYIAPGASRSSTFFKSDEERLRS